MRAEFEWQISDRNTEGYFVRERLCGSDKYNMHGPLPTRKIAESYIKARRAFVHRTITTRAQAIQLFEKRVPQ